MKNISQGVEPSDNKYYVVPMFPYPSGRLHMGHARNYAIADAYARHARALGRSTLFPMGWDSFGLPAEKAAQNFGIDPREWTERNIADMKAQLMSLDLSFDWPCELATHEPSFYMHTQFIFTELMRAGLVYKKKAEVWWDPADQTVLANEQVIDGRGWRSGAMAEKRSLDMYWVQTTRYAEEMAKDELHWSHGAKADHMAWLGPKAAQGEPNLRDWCVSRQRVWGTPLPAIECEACGPSPMPKNDLPYKHSDMGSVCACPMCGGAAKKSTETLDTFFDSSWYYLRYPEVPFNPEILSQKSDAPFGEVSKNWSPVDLYVGGREHATMHLVYARFMARALADRGYGNPREPFARYLAQGMVKSRAFSQGEGADQIWVEPSSVSRSPDGHWVAKDGSAVDDRGVQKMSKSRLNGVDPAEVIKTWGLDAMRLFLFFAAPFESDMEWDERAVAGCQRFAKKFEKLSHDIFEMGKSSHMNALLNVPDHGFNREQASFNCFSLNQYDRHEGLNGLVAAIMKRTGEISRGLDKRPVEHSRAAFLDVCRALSPLAPSLASACALNVDSSWTHVWDVKRVESQERVSSRVTIQVEGKFVASVEMPVGLDAREAFISALASSNDFAAKVEKSGLSWEGAIWVPERALNARSRHK
jgi:leucyl-tRNA synthetase